MFSKYGHPLENGAKFWKISEFSRPVQANCHKTMESSKSKSSKQLNVEDVSQIIREQYNDEVAKKFEGQ